MFQNLQDLALSISNVLNISVLDALKQTIGKIPGLGNFIIYLIEGIPGIHDRVFRTVRAGDPGTRQII